ncbi:unnamed protein product [Orchesella dallaii]|uniref:Odorant receptor n=1 Tax=Orchesella dallaii TaxID=48710 RepID=A0ABP1RMK1_9HEXA
MMFSRIKRIVSLRLHIFKYCYCCPFYWDYSKDKLVLSGPKIFFGWGVLLYGSTFLIPLVLTMLYGHLNSNQLPEEGNCELCENENGNQRLVLVFGTLVSLLGAGILLVALVIQEEREYFRNIYHATWNLISRLEERFGGQLERNPEIQKSLNQYEYICTYACLSSTILTFVFPLTIFHPADPFHRIIEDVFGITVSSFPKITFLLGLAYGWVVFIVENTAIFAIISFLLPNFSSSIWINAFMPQNVLNDNHYYATLKLGAASHHQIIFVYRSHQLLWTHYNALIAKLRISLHFAMLHVLVVALTFIVIRYMGEFLRDGEYFFAFLIVSGLLSSIVTAKLECKLIGKLVKDSVNMKEKLLKLSGRGGFVYKTARSFLPHRALSTYPFFVVTNETFLEFLDICVDHVVNLLLF